MPASRSASWLSDDDDDLAWLLPLADELSSSASDATEATTPSPSIGTASPLSSPLDSSLWSSVDSDLLLPRASNVHASSGVAASQCATPTKPRRKAAARMPKLANSLTRTKHEIGTLREQASELEGMLRRLKKTSARPRPPIGCDAPAASTEWQAMAGLWKGAARQQRELLKRALRENQKLRLGVLDQRGLLKILQRMLLDRALENAVLSEKLLPRSVDADLSDSDRAVMTNMIADLNRLHLSLADAPFVRRATRAPDGGSFFSAHVCRDVGTGRVQLEVASCEEVPFGKAVVDSAVSSSFRQSTPGYRRYDPRPFGGTTLIGLIEELSSVVTPAGPELYRHRRSVRTCSHDNTRSVSLSLGYIEPVDADGQPAPGLTVKAEMWIVRTQKTVVNEATGVQEVSTLMQNFSTLTPVSVRGPYSLQWGQQLFEHVLSPLMRRSGLARLHRLENALMARSAAS